MKNLKIILSKTRTIKIINTIKAYCIFIEYPDKECINDLKFL